MPEEVSSRPDAVRPAAGADPLLGDVYQCAGLRIRSPIPLAAHTVSAPADVELIEGEVRPVPYERPSPDVIAERVVEGVAWYTFARCDKLIVGRLYRAVDFVIDPTTRRVVFHRDPACDRELVAIIIAGTLTAYLLSATGNLVLHASAVEVAGAALAFVGSSGQGKTTVATLLCAEGYALVSDDVLPVECRDGNVTCVPGGVELRVREKSQPLAEWLAPEVPRRRTADERLAVKVPGTPLQRLRLGALVIPWPDRESNEIRARALSAGQAALALARYQRVEGWTSPALRRAQFEAIAAIVTSVPVFDMHVPWGPPFRKSLAAEIVTASTNPPADRGKLLRRSQEP